MSRFAFFTHWKAGSQWITDVLSDRRVLAYVPHVRFKRASDAEYEFTKFISDEGDNVFVAPIFDVSYSLWNALRANDDRAIYVGRDPRDTVTSYVYSVAYSHVSEPFISLARPPLLALDSGARLMMGAALLLRNDKSKLESWGAADLSSGCYRTKYERILEDQEAEFAAMFAFLGWPVPNEVVREVVAAHSFAVRSGGRARGDNDPFSHYRQGVAGDWRNHFDRELARRFEEAFPHLLVSLGYEDTDTWWESVPATLTQKEVDGIECFDNVGEIAHRRVREISDAMSSALRERDERWTRYESEMSERSALLEREVNDLRVICEERLANIATLHGQAEDLERQLGEAVRESEQMREALRRSERTCDERLASIAMLHRQSQELRDQLREAAHESDGIREALRRSELMCDERLTTISALHVQSQDLQGQVLEAARESEELREAIRRSEATCDERLKLIEAQDREITELRSDVDRLMSVCDERLRLMVEQERTIESIRSTHRQGIGTATLDKDIVDGVSTALGEGWYPLEFEADAPFRWAREDATIHVALVHELRYRITLDIEPGPGVHLAPFTLSIRLADGTVLERLQVRGREKIAFDLPPEAPRLFTLVLKAEDGGASMAGDERILDFRVFAVTLEMIRDVFPLWAEPMSGFYAPEHCDGRFFRWVGGDATIALSERRGSTLSFDVESGPGLGSDDFNLSVLAADGTKVAQAVVGSRVRIDIPIERSARFNEITLHAEGGGQVVPGDDRVLNFRVIAR